MQIFEKFSEIDVTVLIRAIIEILSIACAVKTFADMSQKECENMRFNAEQYFKYIIKRRNEK